MMLSNCESGQIDDIDTSSNGDFLREIEEISKSLYLDKKTHISSSDLVPKSESHFPDLKLDPKPSFGGNDEWLWDEKKKPSSIWGWKPFKALSHIRSRKFTTCFFCHVHCIENLPPGFESVSVGVHWKRKDSVLRTVASRVSNGVVEFEETLMSKCVVYGVKNGAGNFVKYEPKHFLVYASVVGAGGLDIGKHWVDLTRLLPVTIEELEEDKCSGRWSTSFKLSGKAKGATLHVSFAFLVMKHGLDELGSSMMDISDLSSSVSGKLEEDRSDGGLTRFDSLLEDLKSTGLVSSSCSSSGKDFVRDEYDGVEPVVIDKSIDLECNLEKEIKSEDSSVGDFDNSVIEVIDVAEIFKGEGISSDEDTKSNLEDQSFENDDPIVKHNVSQIEDPDFERDFLDFNKLFISDTAELELSVDEICGDNEVSRKLVKSFSLDDVAKAVADDFFTLLEEARSPSSWSSNSDLESPRERLLRQFEEDTMTSGSFFLGVKEQDGHGAYSVSSSDFSFKGIDLFPVVDTTRHKSVKQSSKSKTKAKSLERLETESLMQRWGLSEDAFVNSPHYSSGGFGSPINIDDQEPIGLPPLGQGLGPLLHLKDGGILRSMNPSHLKNAKLVVQTSKPVVLPAELGSDVVEILQCLASIGVETLSMQLHKLMPLEELSGRVIHQLAWEASCKPDPLERRSDSVFVEDVAILALSNIEGLTVKGLRIQSGLSDQEPPSRLLGVKGTSDFVERLLDLSITVDKWLSLDSGRFDDKNQGSEFTTRLLAAHHAKSAYPSRDLSEEENSENEKLKCGFLGDSLVAAIMIQLRDPIRNYEPVGIPMLGLIRVERSEGLIEDDKHGGLKHPMFRVNEVHIAGVNIGYGKPEIWASRKQRQSGFRWLLASGLTKIRNSCHVSDSRLTIRQPNPISRNQLTKNLMWSVSHRSEFST